MAVSVSKTLLFTSGPIKYSDLRNQFKQVPSGAISAAELLRNVNVNETNPIVPDATENADISSSTNLRASQFRDSIKTYGVNQSGTDIQLDLSTNATTWNNNLNKNIRKTFNITGTLGSNNEAAGEAAFRLINTIYNLDVIVSGTGRVLGASGDLGTAANPRGNRGGTAIRVISSGNAVNIKVLPGGLVYSGGSGGSKGATGATGAPGTCYFYTYYTRTACGFCPGCTSGGVSLGCVLAGRCRWSRNRTTTCRVTNAYGVPGAPGGVGGNGAPGRGYDYAGSLVGSPGAAGTPGGCPDPNSSAAISSRLGYGGSGANGEKGGDGGNWGARGAATRLVSTGGGDQGNAIEGSNYTVDPSSDFSGIAGNR